MTTSSFQSGQDIYKNVSGVLLNDNISMDIKNTVTNNSIDVQITLFSEKFEYADIEFLYRTDFGEIWMTDAYVSASTAKFINGNQLFRLPCSPTGYENIIRWKYEKNSLTLGNSIQIKIKAIASVATFNNYGAYTIVENVYSNIYNEIGCVVPYKVLGLDNYGNYMCFNNNKFLIIDKNKNLIMQYSGLNNIICANQIYNDNYIILDNGNKKIIEMSESGVLVYQSTIVFSNPYYFTYDKYSNNVLLTDYENVIYEISWNNNITDKGTVIWQYGDSTALDNPTCAIYDSDNHAIVWISDSGNQRIVKIDRSSFTDVISVNYYFTKDGANIRFNPVSRMFSNKDNLILVEQMPEQEFFNVNRNLHPALARAMNLKEGGISSKNNLEDYSNLIFKPITKVVES